MLDVMVLSVVMVSVVLRFMMHADHHCVKGFYTDFCYNSWHSAECYCADHHYAEFISSVYHCVTVHYAKHHYSERHYC
jgi:hypothetical protein